MFTFRAMNTDVAVDTDAEVIAREVARTFADAERRFSRFNPDSELSQLNHARQPVVVSEPLFNALERARGYFEMTDGLFDPAVGGVLIGLGYDRSFSPGTLDRRPAAHHEPAGSFREVGLARSTRAVDRPVHVQLDLGGMIKGATVDAAARHLGSTGAIDAGGDAILLERIAGNPWLVDIEDPRDPERTLATAAISGGAVATSSSNRRRWRVGTATAHHLVDPRTHASSTCDLLQASVFAPVAELADVLAKTAFLLGSREGVRFVLDRGATGAVLVSQDGELVVGGSIEVREADRA